jgi:hypothetical protein
VNKKKWILAALLELSLAAVGLAYGRALVRAEDQQKSEGYVCPMTGEELPCPNCSPAEGR